MNLGELTALLYDHPVVALGLLALLAAILGWRLEREAPRAGKALNHTGFAGMALALMLIVVQAARNAPHSEAAELLNRRPALEVRGGETVVPKASDGHYWVEATVNGKAGWFLIDTGASYTGLAPSFAEEAGVTPDPHRMPVDLSTANGVITARIGTIRELRFGGIVVSDLPAAISPVEDEDTNLIGMNLLSRLATWRVEGDRLVLVPKG